jgi:hypothetical protein
LEEVPEGRRRTRRGRLSKSPTHLKFRVDLFEICVDLLGEKINAEFQKVNANAKKVNAKIQKRWAFES